MTEKINIAELLKDCPKGMELDCSMYDNVVLDTISDGSIYPIKIKTPEHFIFLTKNGCYSDNKFSKCVIFPKGKTTWEGFVPPCKFKDGDVLFVDCSDGEDKTYQYIFILNKIEFYGKWYSYCHLNGVGDFHLTTMYLTDDEFHPRFATEEEKQKLFDAIKDNGYKWNPETKTLEKLPKFKVGDKVVKKGGVSGTVSITGVGDEYYYSSTESSVGVLPIAEQDNWELVPNIKPRFKVGDRIKSIISSSYYTVVDIKNDQYFIKSDTEKYPYQVSFSNEINYKLVPDKFDITTLIPFESRVLMRSSNAREWVGTIYSHYNNNYFFGCGMMCQQCIPYEGNEHLLGTTNDCDEYYKTW